MSSKMAAAIALLLLFALRNKPGCVTHRPPGFLSFSILRLFILRHCSFFSLIPSPCSFVCLFLSLSLSSSLVFPPFLTLPNTFIFNFSVLFVSPFADLSFSLSPEFHLFVLSHSAAHIESLLFAKCNPPIPLLVCHFNPPSCQPTS